MKGFRALGAEVDIKYGLVRAYAEKLTGTHIYLDKVSVGATINIMMAASMAEGKTIIENAAKEPHVVDVANFLNSMGANIQRRRYGRDPDCWSGEAACDRVFDYSGSDRGRHLYAGGSGDQG